MEKDDFDLVRLSEFIDSWIDEQHNRNLSVTHSSSDNIFNKMLELFEGKVGTKYADERYETIVTEGKDRYSKKIPPGYCDKKKDASECKTAPYGDLIIWNQIIDYSSENHKDVIFITHEQKEDWWASERGRITGPKIELIREFRDKTNQTFGDRKRVYFDGSHYHLFDEKRWRHSF
jgi:hypothetical protein